MTPSPRTSSSPTARRRGLALLVCVVALFAFGAVACSGSGKSSGLESNGTTVNSDTGASTDFTDSGFSDSDFSDDFSDDYSDDFTDDFTDSGDYSDMISDFDDSGGAGSAESFRRLFVDACEKGGGTSSLCECVADKLDFNDPSSIGDDAAAATKECVRGG